MLTKKAAIEKIGRKMGQSKFDDAMQGAMLPCGDYLDIAYVLSLVYGGSRDSIYKELASYREKEYKACFERMHRQK